jgi:hypothetical protein
MECPTNPLPTFALRDKEPPAPGARPRTLIQEISRPMSIADFVSSNAMRVLIRRYAQVADAAEKTMSWLGWAEFTPRIWDIIETNVRDAIAIGNEEGLDIALSSANHLDPKICFRYSNALPHRAECLAATTNGTEIRVFLTNSTWAIYESFEVPRFDVADRTTVSNFLDKWGQDLSVFANYSYFFFNEPSLNGWADGSYLRSPTASTNGLAWFREYVVARYGPAHAGIRFPVSPLGYGAAEADVAAAYRMVLDDSVTNRFEITTDPDHWAKWWEWRQVVFAHLMAGYAEQLAALNATNAHWRGMVAFISPQLAWKPWTAINLPLLSRIPDLDWMVMENSRRYITGHFPAGGGRHPIAAGGIERGDGHQHRVWQLRHGAHLSVPNGVGRRHQRHVQPELAVERFDLCGCAGFPIRPDRAVFRFLAGQPAGPRQSVPKCALRAGSR